MCSDFEQDLVASLPDGSFENSAGECSSSPRNIKMSSSNMLNCSENYAVIIDLKAAKRVTMVKVKGDWQYARKFQLFSSMDGMEYTKTSFDSYDVSIIDSYTLQLFSKPIIIFVNFTIYFDINQYFNLSKYVDNG